MANLIDVSYFTGERSIPNSGEKSVMERIQAFIETYEPECLRRMLGYSLSKALLAENPIISGSRFDKLLNGVEYLSNSQVLVQWNGLREMIADYVYFQYLKDAAVQNTGIGTVIKKSEMAINISPASKMTRAWNAFSEKARELAVYLTSNAASEIYPEFVVNDLQYMAFYSAPINEFDI